MKRLVVLLFACIALLVVPRSLPAQSFPGRGTDLNVGMGKTSETGLGWAASSTFYVMPRLRLNPSLFYGEASGVRTHHGTVNAFQYGAEMKGEVPLISFLHHRFEVDTTGSMGYMESRFRYNIVMDGESISGVERERGPFASGGAKLKYRITKHWSGYAGADYMMYGDQTADSFGRWRLTFGGISYHSDRDIRQLFRNKK